MEWKKKTKKKQLSKGHFKQKWFRLAKAAWQRHLVIPHHKQTRRKEGNSVLNQPALTCVLTHLQELCFYRYKPPFSASAVQSL